MEILGIITARGNSKRIPNKNLALFMGKPLLWYTIQAARSAKLLSRVICSSDSAKILAYAKKHRVEPFLRDSEAATDTAPIEEALRDALTALKKNEGYVPDAVVLLYGNVPFRSSTLIDGAIKMFRKNGADAVVSVSGVDRYHPERLVVRGENGAFIPYVRRFSTYRQQELSKVYFIDSGVIVLKAPLLFGKDPLIISHYFKGHKVYAYASDAIGAWDIDNYADMAIGSLLFKDQDRQFII
jgi:CMP-N-acetylneuraminic acid synthetase